MGSLRAPPRASLNLLLENLPVLNTRRVARELALLTMSQLAGRPETAPASVGELLARAADMLAHEARERVADAASVFVAQEHTIQSHVLELQEGPLPRRALEEVLGALDTIQNAVELLGSALELPAMVALADAEETRGFALAMVERYSTHRDEIDRRLAEAAKNWSVDRMAALDRDAMRLAIGELLWDPEVPVEVSINEAVELAKKYGTPDSGKFVNGVLSRFADEAAALRKVKA